MVRFLRLITLIGILNCLFLHTDAQSERMRNGRINACSGQFTDSGGTGALGTGNYRNDEDLTFTICPDEPGRRVSLFFEVFRVEDDDKICFYDGESRTAQVLSCWDDKESQGGLANGGFNRTIQATIENLSGCITVHFESNSRGRALGWRAQMNCVFACQDIFAEIASSIPAISPTDTGWINICLGESLSLEGRGIYPETGGPDSYDQSDATSTFTWDMGDGNFLEGKDVEHTFTEPGGYIVQLEVKDQLGCTNNNAITQRVRVAAPPQFVYEPKNELCIGDTISFTTSINEGAVQGKTISVIPDSAGFQAKNIRADSIALPDGEGVFYESQIRFNTFGPGQTITSAEDIQNVFVNMEHTWMRDLEIELECPSGEKIILHNFVGQRGKEVYLGRPNDNDNNQIIIGEGFLYNWNTQGTDTWIDFADDAFDNERGTLPSQNFSPYEDFSNLIGCPLNGNWIMRIKDLWLFDNGFVFFWGMEFDPDLVPDKPESFEPQIVDFSWTGSDVNATNQDSVNLIIQESGPLPYTFTATDEYGCSKDTTINLNVLSANDPNCVKCDTRFIDLQDDVVSCNNQTVNLEIRTNPELAFYNDFSYSWTPTEGLSCTDCPNPIASPSTPTTYFVSAINNALNCTYEDTIQVNIIDAAPPVIEEIMANSPQCEGIPFGNALATVTVASGPVSYQWSNDPSTNADAVDNIPPGDYTLLVQDENGCTDQRNFTINAPPVGPSTELVSTDIACAGDSTGAIQATVTGGIAPFTYLWSNGESTEQISNLTAGDYSLVVADSNGCLSPLNSITLTEGVNSRPEASILVQVPILCQGNNTGVLDAAVTDGTEPYSFSWSTGSSETSVDRLGPGSYSVTILDALGCSTAASVTLVEPAGDLVSTAIANELSCFGDRNASITTNINSVAEPFFFEWSNGATDQNISNLAAGTYTLTFTDSNGCIEQEEVTINEPSSINDGGQVNSEIECFGDTDGSISLRPSGGTGPYVIAWSNNATTESLTNLSAGAYNYTITDNNGCTFDSVLILSEPDIISIDPVITPPTCFNTNDGQIIVSPLGGTPPFSYQINGRNFGRSGTLTDLSVGVQEIIIQDANGCLTDELIDISEPEEFFVFAYANPQSIELGSMVELNAETENGRGSINFQWSSVEANTINCSDCPVAEVIPLRSSLFEVIATDQNGCQVSDRIEVKVQADRNVRVPTGFTPDGQGPTANNLLHVHGKPGTTINSFQIYNRWGELLFETKEFTVNDMSIGWDGTFRGQSLPAGVYVWRIDVTFLDGFQKTYQGETNLIR